MGPLWQILAKGLSLFVRNPRLPEMIEKRGHVVFGYVEVGNGENGGSLLDHEAITDESSRAHTWRGKMRAYND